LDRTAWTGQPGQDSRDRTARTGKRGQENWDRKVRKTDEIVQPGYKKKRQNSQNTAARTGQLRQDNRDGTTTAVERRYLDRTFS
jgi:hypothetical protein